VLTWSCPRCHLVIWRWAGELIDLPYGLALVELLVAAEETHDPLVHGKPDTDTESHSVGKSARSHTIDA
jgi:hypothetical protein